MGQDNLRTFTKWKNYEQILDKHQIYVYPRIGQNGENEASLTHKNIIICENVPQLELSASLIRQKIKDKKSIAYLTPPAVEKYILEMHFYEK